MEGTTTPNNDLVGRPNELSTLLDRSKLSQNSQKHCHQVNIELLKDFAICVYMFTRAQYAWYHLSTFV